MKSHKQCRSIASCAGRFFLFTLLLVTAALSVRGSSLLPVSVVNTPANPPSGGSSDSFSPIISDDGRYVLFASLANNLALLNVPNPAPAPVPPVLSVFLRDRLNQTTRLVSVSLDGAGGGNGDSMPRGISTNGQYVLFESAASNLVAGDTNDLSDVFVRDVVNNVTALVSVNTNGAIGSGSSRSAAMTPDGGYVAFVSSANDLIPGDTNGIPDVFVRDLQTGTTTLASVGARSTTGGSSELPLITPQGRYVAFYSTATNLVAGVTNTGEIFVRDLLAGTTVWASTNSHAIMKALLNNSNAISCNFEISDNGQFVAFEACPLSSGVARAAVQGLLLRQNLATGATDIVNTNVLGITSGWELTTHNLDLTPDGRFIAFIANIYPNGSTTAVWDGQSNTTVVASLDLAQTVRTNSICDWPDMTPDGRFVVFISNATNLTANPVVNGFHVYLRDLQTGTTALIDGDTNGVGSTSNVMTFPVLSDDGSVVVFEAPDGNLAANDNNRACDIFVRNTTAAATELISVGLPGLPSLAANGSSLLPRACLSANGRFIAFESEADNLGFNDTNGVRDVYVHDFENGSNILVSANTNGIAANGLSKDAVISGNGRFVAFTSVATDLIPSDPTNTSDVFLRDLETGSTMLVSVNAAGSGPGNNESHSPALSEDGRYVMFSSRAGNLVSGTVSNVNGNLFWRDMLAGTNRPLTTFPPSTATTYTFLSAGMTPDGNRVLYGYVFNTTTAYVYVWDADLNQNIYTNTAPAAAIYGTTISPDGRRVVIHRQKEVAIIDLDTSAQFLITNSTTHARSQFSADSRFVAYVASSNLIYLYDFSTTSNLAVSAGANGTADSPTISPNGRFVAYRSAASNLVTGDTNGVPDIFVFDQLTGKTSLVTICPIGGRPANGRSFGPVFGRDGQTLLWQSWATDLAGQTFNQCANLFALHAFGTNTSSESTSPTISAFWLTALSGFGSSASAAGIGWSTVPGLNYLIQFRDSLNPASSWQNLIGAPTLIGTQGFLFDTTLDATQRYYRLVGF